MRKDSIPDNFKGMGGGLVQNGWGGVYRKTT